MLSSTPWCLLQGILVPGQLDSRATGTGMVHALPTGAAGKERSGETKVLPNL